MFWLAYRCENDPCVIVIDAKSIVLARLLAAMVVDGIDTHFIEGGELPTAAHLPAHDAREHPGAACVQLAGATLAKGTDDGLSLGRGIPFPDVGSPPLGRFSISHR
jgi:hypothetical protein